MGAKRPSPAWPQGWGRRASPVPKNSATMGGGDFFPFFQDGGLTPPPHPSILIFLLQDRTRPLVAVTGHDESKQALCEVGGRSLRRGVPHSYAVPSPARDGEASNYHRNLQ